ncbi:hypothetical protein BDP81DRAFT_434428 [Colletotrichum phormii]|uniref:Uncharacterized protein n=1 Tax=Colletotrichum phormii TaxID=359342 RepID=A0AAJ0EB42_9PEZI|nr:uncharacterized protein BDP81DRAFT_434428 [Colletotrichum phormii]KAK1633202.1 hypothetical protein BDP81DRAFT_434428 [Colletotrichum phormii]
MLRPWKNILQEALKAMEEAGEFSFAGGHREFWQRLDQQMAKVSQNDEALEVVFRDIERMMLLGPEQLALETLTEPLISTFSEAPMAVVTATQVKQKRRHRKQNQTSNPNRPNEQSIQGSLGSSSPSHLPQSLKLQKSDFLLSLRNGTRRTFSWTDFRTALCSVGFTMEPVGGSAFRFVLFEPLSKQKSSIIFHKPHGKSSEVALSLGQARQVWLKRLERHFGLNKT